MKKYIIVAAAFVSLSCTAQSLENIGLVMGRNETFKQSQEREAAEDRQRTAQAIGNVRMRQVGTNVYDAAGAGWKTLPLRDTKLQVDEITTDGIICEELGYSYRFRRYEHSGYILLKNYTDKKLVTGNELALMRAMETGRTNYWGRTIPVYDVGTVWTPPPPSEEAIAAAKAAAAKAAAERKAKAEASTLKFHEQLAAKGDAYGQLRMGQRYLAGDGVAQDEAKGRALLEQSAAQGNAEAKALLKK